MSPPAASQAESTPWRPGDGAPGEGSGSMELMAALAVVVLLTHLLLAQLTLLLAVVFYLTGRVSRWRLPWLAVPAVAGLLWTLAIGPARAVAGLTAGPRQVLGLPGRDRQAPRPSAAPARCLRRRYALAAPAVPARADPRRGRGPGRLLAAGPATAGAVTGPAWSSPPGGAGPPRRCAPAAWSPGMAAASAWMWPPAAVPRSPGRRRRAACCAPRPPLGLLPPWRTGPPRRP